MITDWVGGVQRGQNIDYVIFERSLRMICLCEAAGTMQNRSTYEVIYHSHIEEENLLMKPSWGNFPFLKFLNWHNTFILLPIFPQVLIFSKTTYKIQWHFQKCKNFENCTTRTQTMKKVLSIGHRNWFYVISIPMRNWI